MNLVEKIMRIYDKEQEGKKNLKEIRDILREEVVLL